MRKLDYGHTINASYIAYITQAAVNNFVPLLFLTFISDFGLTLDKITFITTLNFAVQLLVDLISTKFIDKIGYRPAVVSAHAFSAAGLLGLAFLPELVRSPYMGIILSVILYAVGGGIAEVLISPIVEACPTKRKEAAMSLLHSFYCWGHVGVVLVSTLFFTVFGLENWRILACIWAAIPIFNMFYFMAVPIYSITENREKIPLTRLVKEKTFWILLVVMVCAGASEQAMSQWASAFAESALNVSKTVGDLAGPCAFALMMGGARALYGKFSDILPLKKIMVASGILCIASYAIATFTRSPLFALIGCALCGFSVGIFWPGTFSIAAWNLRGGGTALYALMALAGDLGCSSGPGMVGMIADLNGGNLKLGLAFAIAFPAVICLLVPLLKNKYE